MQIQQILATVITIVSVLSGSLLARADDSSLPPQPRKEFCKENPDKCKEAQARRQEFCATNPEQCEQMKHRRAERREFCKANPEKCKEQREQIKAKCDADPAKCQEIKDQARQKMQGRMDAAPPAN
jgi:hypothetical protein